MSTKPLLVSLAALTGALATHAQAEEAPPTYTVVEADARLSFAPRRISGYRVGEDGSLLISAGPNEWYRATLFGAGCRNDLRWAHYRIGVDTRPNGVLDRFGTIVIEGRRCAISTFDRIERPSPGS
jgi:hypothetical protein